MIAQRVLVVDDEPQIQRFLKAALTAAEYTFIGAETGAAAVRFVAHAAPDAVLLDLGLPDRDGQEVIKDIRAFSAVPIIVISARDREAEKIMALDNGADDFVEKPFGIGELLARLRTTLRHVPGRDPAPTSYAADGLVVDFNKRQVARDGIEIRLTPKEYDLLVALARRAGRVVTHRQILEEVWGRAHAHDTQYLRVFIGQLRAKIERHASKPTLIRTEPGVGYRIADGSASLPS